MTTYENIGGSKQFARGNYKEIIDFREQGKEYNENLCLRNQWVIRLYSGDTLVMRFVHYEEPTEESFEKDIAFYEEKTFGKVEENTLTQKSVVSTEKVDEIDKNADYDDLLSKL